MSSLTDLYLESLTPKEKQAYLIAKDHLKSLFDLENTNGFYHFFIKHLGVQDLAGRQNHGGSHFSIYKMSVSLESGVHFMKTIKNENQK